MSPKYISLFSGAMGLDIGLERAGFKCIVANEIDELAVKTIQFNRPEIPVIRGSIEHVNLEDLNAAAKFDVTGVDLIAGGPPCQAFSVFGQRKGLHDGRGKMIFEFHRIVRAVKPKVFLMENVRGLHSMPLVPSGEAKSTIGCKPEHLKPGSLLDELLNRFESIGYRVTCFLVNSVNYGAPQIRERLLCIGTRFDVDPVFPGPAFSNRPEDGLPPFRTLGDAIGGSFKDPDTDLMDFSERKLRYLAMVPPGGNWRSLPEDVQKESMGKSWYLKGGRSAYWRRLSFAFPSPTVVTMPNHAGTSMCHPKKLRALTVGEMAAIQEFPREWKFIGSAVDKCRQIGNAVPPRLGEVAGTVIKSMLREIKGKEPTRVGLKAARKIMHIRPHVRTKSYFKDGEASAGDVGYYGK